MGGDALRVYIAAPWNDRFYAKMVAEKFIAAGHTITHDWWNYDVPDQDTKRLAECAEDDYDAVINADYFFLMNLQKRGEETSGKAVETGIALVCSREWGHPKLIGMGEQGTNIFQYVDDFEWVDSVEDALGQIN